MTTHWPNIARRVAAQIRMFSSDIDPEVLGAVRGIGRTLRSHAMDFHDFAAVIERTAENKPPPVRRDGLPPRWSTMPSHEQIAWLDALDRASNDLSPRERAFLDSLADMMARWRTLRLSKAQVAFVDSMISSAWRRGVEP